MVFLRFVIAVACGLLTGCGLQVPDIQEFGGRVEGQRFVQAILINITCELRDALTGLHATFPQGTFIDDWGVQMTLTLTFDEKGVLAPGVSWLPGIGNNEFTFGAGIDLSSNATTKSTPIFWCPSCKTRAARTRPVPMDPSSFKAI